jgi:putative effector of murein hydrolase LrgA (UPF0299 family)
MRLDSPAPDAGPPVDARLVGTGALFLLAAGLLFVPTGVGTAVSVGLVAVACGAVAVAAVRSFGDRR